ncbi:MAG: hypothetical protein LBD77_08910, partial [Bifidobacteriaceae bacterium]|nr:hypothetical protein [Bifidobacteriaceae bacterium]
MSNGAIFVRTLPFVFFRLLASLALVSALGAYAALVLLGVGLLLGTSLSPLVSVVIVVVFGILGIGVYRFLARYISYMVKAAHVAVIGELAANGRISTSDGIISYGAGKVRQRFASANVFFVLDSLVAGAVKQIQNAISAASNWLSAVPGVKQIAALLRMFTGIVLNYVDEAVLSHIFRADGVSAWKGAADGIVLYFQHWKAVLKNAAWIVLFLLVWYFGGGVSLFFAFSLMFKAMIPTSQIAIFLSILAAVTVVALVKAAVVDPLILIAIINNYTKVTLGVTPAIDLYEKARRFSSRFRKIEQKAGPAAAAAAAPAVIASAGGSGGGAVAFTAPAPQYGGDYQPAAAAPQAAAQAAAQQAAGAQQAAPQQAAPQQVSPQQAGAAGVAAHVGTTLRRTRFRPFVSLSNPVGTVAHIIRTDLVNQSL